MTVIDDRPYTVHQVLRPAVSRRVQPAPGRSAVRPARRAATRPAIAPIPYRGHRIAVSRTPHPRRGVSTPVTIALAGLAALITLWLGVLAQFSGGRAAAPVDPPSRLAVVQVQAGETLQHVAARVAPGASTAAVVDEIRSLNQLDSSALDAGQTLVAPVS